MKRESLWGRFSHDMRHRGVGAWLVMLGLMTFYVVLYFGQYFWTPDQPCTSDETCWNEAMMCTEAGECIPKGGLERAQMYIYNNATIHLDEAGWALFRQMDEARDPDGSLSRDDNDNGVIDNWEHFGSRWTIYGLLYTIAILLGGAYMFVRYRHNRYQLVRTGIVMFVQTSFAFSIPILLKFFHQPEYYFSYMWPLKMDYLDPKNFAYYGEFYVLYGFFASLVIVPVMTIFYGKRWYCSWVCGCGGLANTFGEPWRHLSNTSPTAWKIEKVTIHAMLILAFLTTFIYFGGHFMPENETMTTMASGFRKYYGLIVVAALSGALGTALYPIGGTRIWCRFFCPMAALLGIIQKLGRFRIRVKKDMCISCGMCSTYCEMGIDVRAYAQNNQSFTRASCVGCGMCSEVCPSGVLRLENAPKARKLSLNSLIDETWKGQ